MSVAQVLNVSGLTGSGEGPPSGAGEAVKAVKALDGLEHIFILGNPGTGSGMTIVVWRDKAAMEAGHAEQQARRKQAQEETGTTITTTTVYDVFTEL